MAVRDPSRSSRQRSQRRRVRRRAIAAILILLGVVLWGGTAIVAATVKGFPPEALVYLGITVGGAAVIGGILLVSTTA